jgi:hypothetical protein
MNPDKNVLVHYRHCLDEDKFEKPQLHSIVLYYFRQVTLPQLNMVEMPTNNNNNSNNNNNNNSLTNQQLLPRQSQSQSQQQPFQSLYYLPQPSSPFLSNNNHNNNNHNNNNNNNTHPIDLLPTVYPSQFPSNITINTNSHLLPVTTTTTTQSVIGIDDIHVQQVNYSSLLLLLFICLANNECIIESRTMSYTRRCSYDNESR